MATIDVEGVTKVYPGGAEAVSELDVHVADGEFLILVGPSGCGKTTALRMIAGLEEITDGTVRIGDRVVNELSPRERDVAMVFQNYALYPHMTVAENIGFALSLQKIDKQEIRRRVGEAAEILGLGEHLQRKPAQLSGGQRQRVAMGRAIVREPAAFLMDEPLSNLDAKLRVQMRSEIARIQRRVGVATVYVTHDQIEAMTMGDRVAVMRSGRLQQCDAPQTLYDAPTNLFVAAFIGSPAMNLYQAEVDTAGERLRLGEQALELPETLRTELVIGPYRGRSVVVGIRPEDLADAALVGEDSADGRLRGEVDLVEALGAEKLVHFRIDARRLDAHDERLSTDEDVELGSGEIGAAASTAGVARVPPASAIEAGTQATFAVAVERLHLFDPDSGEAVRPGAGRPQAGLRPEQAEQVFKDTA
ncbi:MAG TPA: sn-glycerol-3-phosphate ABC transporter ATP-binding protein UgpC [Solirubrobacteraceae bacterium]|jgi:multiple sugar transport system ATP-binding protein|nr:sn-glycerol-3-phosphate ABC transporter ATP-binding protein UgpC [Solirubrobacteraceae bacterium]